MYESLTSLDVQLNQVAVDFAVAGFGILEHTIQTGEVDIDGAIKSAKGDVKASLENARDCNSPHVQAVKSWGLHAVSMEAGQHTVQESAWCQHFAACTSSIDFLGRLLVKQESSMV
jgi:hypothetical protein